MPKHSPQSKEKPANDCGVDCDDDNRVFLLAVNDVY